MLCFFRTFVLFLHHQAIISIDVGKVNYLSFPIEFTVEIDL